MAEHLDPVYSSNALEGEYMLGIITEYINLYLDTS